MARIVIALGGNALLQKSDKGTIKEQLKRAKQTVKHLLPIIENNEVILTHGNGPQVGNLLIQQEKAKNEVQPLPLYICNAMTQAQIGILLQNALQNELKKITSNKKVITMLTQVMVDPNDKAFLKPTKFIGPYYPKEEAKRLERKDFIIKQDPRGDYRRVVPSPKPLKIVERHQIEALVNNGFIVIACGGGGIPVIKAGNMLKGVEAVIDKDLAAEKLAHLVKADILLILTDVSNAFINFGKRNQKPLKRVSISKLKKLKKAGHFGSGSMLPKIEAIISFIEKGGKKAIITSLEKAALALKGKAGTIVEAWTWF